MTVATRIDWDQWRAEYDRMTFRQHQEFNARVAEQHPSQRQSNPDAVRGFLNHRDHASVVELGGWDGWLAEQILGRDDSIVTWVNYDITPNVPQVCHRDEYEKVTLIDWPWNCHITADVLIASHVFEHMRISEVEKLVREWDVDAIYVDIPVGDHVDWRGYEGTHIIEVGWQEFMDRMADCGYPGQAYEAPVGIIAYLDRA